MEDDRAGQIGPDETDTQRRAWLALPRRLFRFFLAFDVLFVVLYALAVWVLHLEHSRVFVLFNLDAEANPPAWFSGMQLLLVGIGFFMLWSRLIPQRPKVTALRPLWLLLAIGFTFLSADEIGRLHEQLSGAGSRANVHVKVSGHALFGDRWEWVYVALGVILLLAFHKQLVLAWKHWRPQSIQFVVGFTLIFLGAAVLEALHLRFHRRFFFGWRDYAETATEEFAEMIGSTVLLLPPFRILAYAMIGESADPPSG